jgi:hypothetical protein
MGWERVCEFGVKQECGLQRRRASTGLLGAASKFAVGTSPDVARPVPLTGEN